MDCRPPPDVESFAIPRFVINRLVAVRRVGNLVECFFGLGEPGTPCSPDYSVVMTVTDAPKLLEEVADAFSDAGRKVVALR